MSSPLGRLVVLDGASQHTTLVTDLIGTDTDDTSVDSARDAVLLLDVQARKDVGLDSGHLLKITSGRSVNNSADDELTDGLGGRRRRKVVKMEKTGKKTVKEDML